MHDFLSNEEINRLCFQHHQERDRRIADRIKAVLMYNDGWTYQVIAKALLLNEKTIRQHLYDYHEAKKLKPENGGSESRLDEKQTQELTDHLEVHTYVKASDICAHIQEIFGITYTVNGMTAWLHAHDFTYKEPKGTPSKADPIEQKKFIEFYNQQLKTKPANEPVIFLDAVHPTMATKISHGWIKKGVEKEIFTTASRTRVNLIGALKLDTMEVISSSYETINSDSVIDFFDLIIKKYPEATKIHVILDQSGYQTSTQIKEWVKKSKIILHYLPAYSPNLNPIERLWKVMNKYVRNNRFFKSAKEFKDSILGFFKFTWSDIAFDLRSWINDNFQTLKRKS